MNIKRNIIFALESRKKAGVPIVENVPIRMRANFASKRIEFTTGYRIDSAKWDADKMAEKDIEQQLVSHITKYLLEMGSGFAFVAQQKHFEVGDSDFYADLILYNIQLHAYVVIELKATQFKLEYMGQLNFYINVVDDTLRGEHDNKTIGLLLCNGGDKVVAQYALSGYDQPIGVNDYQLSKAIPENLKSALPTVEEVEEELHKIAKK